MNNDEYKQKIEVCKANKERLTFAQMTVVASVERAVNAGVELNAMQIAALEGAHREATS